MKVLGISCFYHDAAVAAVEDGEVKYAIMEERVSRKKHDSRFPVLAISKALEFCQWNINDVDEIVFYENPEEKFERIFHQVLDAWPKSWKLFSEDLPYFLKYKFNFEKVVRDKLRYKGKVSCGDHHRSHAASAFYTSPFDKALVITNDGVGEKETTAVYLGDGSSLNKLKAIEFPNSLGLFYSVFTQYLGFIVNNGEYKVMGLAPYGDPKYFDKIYGEIILSNEDGSYHLNQKYFDFKSKDKHYKDVLVDHLGIKPRTKDAEMTQDYMDLAASVQKVLEKVLHNMFAVLIEEYDVKNICLAGGVALNCTANAELIRKLGIKTFIQPAAGDSGGALGAALYLLAQKKGISKFSFNPYLGSENSDSAIEATLKMNNIKFYKSENTVKDLARFLEEGKIVSIVHGRDEWGPRALGNRSILADSRPAKMKDHLNAKIKFREEFRPFAPIVMEEHFSEYFETLDMEASPYMQYTQMSKKPEELGAVTHVNNTSRVQTVSRDQNDYMYDILDNFKNKTGCPVLINTSFNLKGEPIVSTASDALKTFYASGIDVLAIEDFVIVKE